jgi:hypothetical protein
MALLLVIIHLDFGVQAPDRGELPVSVEASEMVSIPRAELDALKAELRRLRREVGPADRVTIWYPVTVHEGQEVISIQQVSLDT